MNYKRQAQEFLDRGTKANEGGSWVFLTVMLASAVVMAILAVADAIEMKVT